MCAGSPREVVQYFSIDEDDERISRRLVEKFDGMLKKIVLEKKETNVERRKWRV